MVYLEIFILLTVIAFLLYKWSTATFNTFKQRGIAHDPPIPLLGNLKLSLLLESSSFLRESIEQHCRLKVNKVYGIYSMRDPSFVISDVELIKQVGVKDFDHFANHRSVIRDSDSVLSKSLISLRDQQWKEMRNTLTPTFTGVKMRLMYELINACSVEGVKYIKAELENNAAEGAVELEMKEYFTRFTNDVIASAAFGINVNSFKEKENDFFRTGKAVTQISGLMMVKFLLFAVIPKLMKALGAKMFDEKNMGYLKNLVIGAIKYREEHKIIRPDMIHLLMEAKRHFEAQKSEKTEEKGEHAEFNDDDLLAQCVLFFFAGFETVSTCLCFTSYELIKNPDVQNELYEEILAAEKELDGKPLDYDTLMKMKYMDMVISESLRKWPPAIATDRQCSADVDLKDEDGNLIVSLKKNDILIIPIFGLHHDPDNFEEPLKFDPLRFSDERKHDIKHMTYLPFGVGPRNCIGNRLALMEVKSIIYNLVLNYKLVPAAKTVEDMMDSIKGLRMQPKELFWCKFVPRSQE